MNSQAYPLTLLDFQLTFYMIALYAHVMFKSCDACVQVILYQGAITDRNSSLIVSTTYNSYIQVIHAHLHSKWSIFYMDHLRPTLC